MGNLAGKTAKMGPLMRLSCVNLAVSFAALGGLLYAVGSNRFRIRVGKSTQRHRFEPQTVDPTMRATVLSFLCLATVIAYVQRAALGVLSKPIEAELGISQSEMGLIMGTWYWVYAVAQLPAGWLADWLGSRRGLVVSLAVWSLLTGAVGLAGGLWELLVLWGWMGLAQAALFPCATKAIGAIFPPSGRAFGSGMLGCCMALGWTICPLLTWKLDTVTTWQTTFALYALPGLILAGAFALIVPRYSEPVADNARMAVDWKKLVTDGPMLLLCLQQFLRAAGTAFFFTWFARYLTETRGISKDAAGQLALWPGIGGMLGGLCGGSISAALLRWTGKPWISRQGMAVAAMVLGAGFVYAATRAKDIDLLIAWLTAGAFLGYACGVSGYTVAIEYGGARVATVFATMNMSGNIGAGLFSFAVGWIVDEWKDWNLALMLVAGLYAADAVCWMALNPKGTLYHEGPE